MFENIIVRRYLLMIGRSSRYVILVGEKSKLDRYIMSKFGANCILSSEDLDGAPIIHTDLTNDVTECRMLNRVIYE